MKLGLCLSGGGARGAYQVGVCKAFQEAHLLERFDAFSGTSIGAVNAAFLATKSVDELVSIWEATSSADIKNTESIFQRLRKEKHHLAENGLFVISKLQAMIEEHLDYDTIQKKEVYVTLAEAGEVDSGIFGLMKSTYHHFIHRDSKVHYALLAEQEASDVIKLILASCSIPIAFPAVQIESRQYYDGGLYDNVPVEPLSQAGCDKVIVIHLTRIDRIKPEHYPNVSIFEIKHKGSLGGILHFEGKQAQQLIQKGYEDGLALLPDIFQFLDNQNEART